jgi:uncharacterized protein (TIGR02266 family)
LRQALADAQQEAGDARRALEQMRRERDALKLQLAAALQQLAEYEEVLENLDRPALPPPLITQPPLAERAPIVTPPPLVTPPTLVSPLVTPPPSLIPAPEPAPFISVAPGAEPPFISLMPGADDAPVSLSRMVVSTRPPAEMETEVRPSETGDPNERPSSIERRRRARLGCEFEVEFLGESHLIAGLTQDISEGGVFVATYQELPLGTVVSLGLELPSGRVVVQGAVRWRRNEVEDSDLRPGLGIQFIDLDPRTVAVLTDFCRTHPAHYYEI